MARAEQARIHSSGQQTATRGGGASKPHGCNQSSHDTVGALPQHSSAPSPRGLDAIHGSALADNRAKGNDGAKCGSILLVEDHFAARLALGDYLDDLGYRTLRAATATAALSLVARLSSPVDVLLTDFGLPDIPGNELARAIKGLWPTVHVIYMSGHDPEIIGLEAGDSFLPKPLDLEKVSTGIELAMGAARAKSGTAQSNEAPFMSRPS